jgi:hypothetical protein
MEFKELIINQNKFSIMFEVKQQHAHGGDAQFYLIESLPKGAKKIVGIAEKIIARGETSGHAHIVTGDVEMFELNGQMFAVVGKDGAYHQHYKESMITEKTFATNKNISNCDHVKDCPIAPGIYAIGLDRQYDPHQGLWVKNPD